MLTQGWTRFDIKKVLLDIYPEHPHPPEVTQKFTGTISGPLPQTGKRRITRIFDPALQLLQTFPPKRQLQVFLYSHNSGQYRFHGSGTEQKRANAGDPAHDGPGHFPGRS